MLCMLSQLATLYLNALSKTTNENAIYKHNVQDIAGFGFVYKAPGDNCLFQPPHFDIAHPLGVTILVPIWKTQNGTMIYKCHPKVERLRNLSHVWMQDSKTAKIVSFKKLFYLCRNQIPLGLRKSKLFVKNCWGLSVNLLIMLMIMQRSLYNFLNKRLVQLCLCHHCKFTLVPILSLVFIGMV